MIDQKVLCEKITSSYPEIGACGIDVAVAFDKKKDSWLVDLRKEESHLQTLLEIHDAEKYLVGEKCLCLSMRVAQIVKKTSIGVKEVKSPIL